MNIKVEYQGLTNSSQFRNLDGTVDIEAAFDFYYPTQAQTKKNLKFLIENSKREDIEIFLKDEIKRHADMLFTLFEAYKQ
jgi:hypothetical protein